MLKSNLNLHKKNRVLIVMTGSIACFKACMVISKLAQSNVELEVAMTHSALKFIGSATIEGLIGKPPRIDSFQTGEVMGHIHLMRWADLILIMPATANFINKMAHGFGDDLASTLFLAHDFSKPMLIAPAMNTKMYLHPTTQESLNKLRSMKCEILESESGVLACGEVGWGRLLEPTLILQSVNNRLELQAVTQSKSEDKVSSNLSEEIPKQAQINSALEVLITSGGTEEQIDSVRSISNFSTGKTGNDLAQSFIDAGFRVTHLKSKRSLSIDRGNSEDYQAFEFGDFASLKELLKGQLNQRSFDYVIHLAAVSDYSVAKILIDGKETMPSLTLKISSDSEVELKLKRNPKLLESIKPWSSNKNLKIVGFKLTSQTNPSDSEQKNEIFNSVSRVFESGADLVVQNDMNEIISGQRKFNVFANKDKFTPATGSNELFSVIFNHILRGVQ